MRLLRFARLHFRLSAHGHSLRTRAENRLSHPNHPPNSLPARHSHLALAPWNSLDQFPGNHCAARMTGLEGCLPSSTTRHAFPICAEPSYPEPLPQLMGDLAPDGAALHPNCATFSNASLSRRHSRFGATTPAPPTTPRRSTPPPRPPSGRPVSREQTRPPGRERPAIRGARTLWPRRIAGRPIPPPPHPSRLALGSTG